MSRDGLSLAVDIGGTFTDVVLELDGELATLKVLTTPEAPEVGLLHGIDTILSKAGRGLADVGRLVHGTTLATNALIERKGAKTALIATAGFRDILEIGTEGRYDQYRLALERPSPLVPRPLRFVVRERMNARGAVRLALDLEDLDGLIRRLAAAQVTSVAVCLLHSYVNGDHERAVARHLTQALPGIDISLSSEVCPEIHEYERTSTTVANAYVKPLMAGYLAKMEAELHRRGFRGSATLMTSGGGLTSIAAARDFPVRLIESGPAGGTIFASRIAQAMDAPRALAFDMGGTTAKVTLVDDFGWNSARTFEVDRIARFMKGSGLPVRIPCIDMVEIGAGGGSLASASALDKVTVGPESAGSAPGPASYGHGGERPAVTDADVALGLLDADAFAGGTLRLDRELASRALAKSVAEPLGIDAEHAAYAVYETVCENMANAARVHCVERGTDVANRTVIAFGGAAPLHVARVAEKIGARKVVVPSHAGVGSAVGFLHAPVSYETVRSRYMRLDDFDAAEATRLLDELAGSARGFVVAAAVGTGFDERRQAHMRYVGQGQEIVVDVPLRPLESADAAVLRASFESRYARLFVREVPRAAIEITSWSVFVGTASAAPAAVRAIERRPASPHAHGRIFDGRRGEFIDVARYRRDDLVAGMQFRGPAIVSERETSTYVSDAFDAFIDGAGSIVMELRSSQ